MTTTSGVFASDAHYLQAEWEWLRARAQRLACERLRRQGQVSEMSRDTKTVGKRRTVADHDGDRRLAFWKDREAELRTKLDQDLDGHRRAPLGQLGLDRLCLEHDLSALERLALLVTTLCATSRVLAAEVLDDLSPGMYGAVVIEDMVLLNVDDPGDVAELLRSRATFAPDCKLLRRKLVTITYPSTALTPQDFLRGTLEITPSAFCQVTGMMGEAVDHAGSGAERMG